MAGPVEVGEAVEEEKMDEEVVVVRVRVEVVRVEEGLDELGAAREEGETVVVFVLVLVGFDEALEDDELAVLDLNVWSALF